MNVSDALKSRRTVRGFLPEPVPDALIREIFSDAQASPSNCNTQPWHASVVSGPARDRLAEALVTHIMAGATPAPVFQPGDTDLQGVYRERQIACAADYYGVMGVTREDKDGRNALMLKNWQFFGAPHVAFLSMPTSMGPVNAIDVGIYLQSLMLLMVEHGLASCPQGALAIFPQPVLKIAQIPDDHGILCGLSFGYADDKARINRAVMPRAPLDQSVSFVT